MFSLSLIYKIFTPLTIYSVVGLLKLSQYQIAVIGDVISINLETFIQIVPACVAGSAYLLLLILNLSVPMKLKQRLYAIIFSFAILFIVNVLRIYILALLYRTDAVLFDFTHKFFWLSLSILIVIAIWFFIVKLFSIKEIPVLSDIETIIDEIK